MDEDDLDGLSEEAWLAIPSGEPTGEVLDDDLSDMPDGDFLDQTPACAADPDMGFGPGGYADATPPGVPLHMLAEQAVDGGLGGLTEAAVVGVIAAARRLRNRAGWLEMMATREFARRRWEDVPAPVRGEDGRWLFKNSDAEHAADELSFQLTESRIASEGRMDLSLALRDRMPKLAALWAAGLLDEHRCQAVNDIIVPLSQDHARQVDEMLAGEAPWLRYDLLRKRAAKLAMKLDPEADRKRKEKATKKKARVEVFPEKSGNSALAGRELPADQALASRAYVQGLARHLHDHGVQGSLREIELMIFLDLTQGRDPLDRMTSDGEPASQGRPGADDDTRDYPEDREARQRDGGSQPAGQDWRASEGWRDDEWDDYDEDEGDDEQGLGDGDDGGHGSGGGPSPCSPPGPGKPGGRAPFPANINILVPAGTQFGWSAMPGEVGREIIDPVTLREMLQAASRHPATRWCVTLVGCDGTATAHGCARGQHTWDPPSGTVGTAKPGTGTPTRHQAA